MDSEPLAVISAIAPALEALGVRYFIGGSIASSTHGAHRATFDVDFVVELTPEDVDGFVAALEGQFFVDDQMVRSEVRPGGTFNIYFKATSDKADFFVSERDAWCDEQMSRRMALNFGDSAPEVYVASPEDIVLQKLRWYKMTNERSDKQWGDVTGVMKEQAGWLETDYMRSWAVRLGVADLLERALDESGVREGEEQ